MLTPSLPPARYDNEIDVSFTVDNPNITKVAYTLDGTQPVISEYIAYDQLNPPNPFLAVTQDGRGNVVYDGGFPKFYNSRAPGPEVTSFEELNGEFKFLYNAIKFCARTPLTSGRQKILVIGDGTANSYNVKQTNSNGFRTSFERIAEIVDFDLVIKNKEDWGTIIDVRLSELMLYDLIIIMSSASGLPSGHPTHITPASVNDILTYRERGGGLIVITDHGKNCEDIDDARVYTSGSFFNMGNQIITNFGAYFTGDFNRSPVNVGYIRNTFGDHPLLNNLDDSESIWAGGSESEVRVIEVETINPNEIPTFNLDGPDTHVISFLLLDDEGNGHSYRFMYTVGAEGYVSFKSKLGETLLNPVPTTKRFFDYDIIPTEEGVGTVEGVLFRNEIEIASFTTIDGVTTYTWFHGQYLPTTVVDGVNYRVEVRSPVLFTDSITLTKDDVVIKNNFNENLKDIHIGEYDNVSYNQLIYDMQRYCSFIFNKSKVVTIPESFKVIKDELRNEPTPTLDMYVYSDVVEDEGFEGNVGYSQLNSIVYRRENNDWTPHLEVNLLDIFERNQTILTQDGRTCHVKDWNVLDCGSGFLGEVPTDGFINGIELAELVEFEEGTAVNTYEPWLKFYDGVDNRTKYIAKKPFRNAISWDQLNTVDLVYGKEIAFKGSRYLCRLVRGSTVDPYDGSIGYDTQPTWGSEWNRLMYPICALTGNATYDVFNPNGPQPGTWASYNQTTDLSLLNDPPIRTWVQETYSDNPNHRLVRGIFGVAYSSRATYTDSSNGFGWRPLLEYLGPVPVFVRELPSTELINGIDLATLVGLTTGVEVNSDGGWLEFKDPSDGKTKFIAKKPFRHSISWDQINAVDCVYGKQITIGGHQYTCRLIKGANSDPYVGDLDYDTEGTWNSEWNRLLYSICLPTGNATYDNIVDPNSQGFAAWASYNQETDLIMVSTGGSGSYSWCQESQGANRVVRGQHSVTRVGNIISTNTNIFFGWRPLLELVE